MAVQSAYRIHLFCTLEQRLFSQPLRALHVFIPTTLWTSTDGDTLEVFMAAAVEARSLSSLTNLAANPPKYPRNPSQRPQDPLVLYIARVPGSQGT